MKSTKSLKNKSNPSVYDIERSYRSNILAPILSLIAFVLLFDILPFASAAREIAIGESNYTIQSLAKSVKSTYTIIMTPCDFASSGFYLTLVATLIGMIAGIIAFRFVNSKKQVNVYYSLGISRHQLFAHRAIATLSMLFVSVLIPVVIDIIINANFFGYSINMLSNGMLMLFSMYAAEAAAFGITAIAMSLSGSIGDSILLSSSIIMFPTAFFLTIGNTMKYLLNGFVAFSNTAYDCFERTESLVSKLAILNPIFFLKQTGGSTVNDTFFDYTFINKNSNLKFTGDELNYAFPVIIWVGISSLVIVIARQLFIKRKVEFAGMKGINKAGNTFSALSLSLLFGGLFIILSQTALIGKWSIPIAIIAMAIIYFVIQLIATRHFKLSMKSYKPILALVALYAVFAAIICSGGFGYSKYVPASSDIKEAFVSIPANDGLLCDSSCYGSYGTEAGEAFDAYSAVGPLSSKEDLSKLCGVMNAVINDENNSEKYCVYVNYKLQNGRTVKRLYTRVSNSAMERLLSLTDTDAYEKTIDNVFSSKPMDKTKLDAKGIYQRDYTVYTDYFETVKYTNSCIHSNNMYLMSANGRRHTNLGKPNSELLNAIANDLKKINWKETFLPEQTPVAILVSCESVNANQSLETLSDMQISGCATFYVYPYMTETVKYINSNKLLDKIADNGVIKKIAYTKYSNVLKSYSSDTIESATFHQYLSRQFIAGSDSYLNDYEDVESGDQVSIFDKKSIITDKKQIEEIKKVSYPSYFTDKNGYLVGYYYEDGSYLSMYVPSSQAPNFIK